MLDVKAGGGERERRAGWRERVTVRVVDRGGSDRIHDLYNLCGTLVGSGVRVGGGLQLTLKTTKFI